MRYTTIIDITEIPAVYRNRNAALLYVYMALRAGYHDDDRDILDISIRGLAAAAGLTFSATRHALHLLEASQLITRQGDAWLVRKWLPAQTITPRPKKTEKELKTIEEQTRARERQAKKEDQERRKTAELAAQGKTQFMLYYEGLQQKAAQGDTEAAKLLAKHAATYNEHKKQMEEKQNERT